MYNGRTDPVLLLLSPFSTFTVVIGKSNKKRTHSKTTRVVMFVICVLTRGMKREWRRIQLSNNGIVLFRIPNRNFVLLTLTLTLRLLVTMMMQWSATKRREEKRLEGIQKSRDDDPPALLSLAERWFVTAFSRCRCRCCNCCSRRRKR